MTTASELRKLIDDAFGAMPYPGDDHIVYDNSGYHLECNQIRQALAGKHWRDVSFDDLDHLRSSLPFLALEGFRFYLPAYMTASVSDFRRADVIPDSIHYHLTSPRLSDAEELRASMERFRGEFPNSGGLTAEDWKQIDANNAEFHLSGEAQRRFDEIVSGFTEAQGRAIRGWFEYMRDVMGHEFSGEPQTAIDRYWHRF